MPARFANLAATLALACCGGSHADTDPMVSSGGKTPVPTTDTGSGSASLTPAGMPSVGSVDTTQSTGSATKIHGANWQDTSDPDANKTGGAQFSQFKETWVYVDGEPKGALLLAEIPSWLPVQWMDDVEGLDFNKFTPADKRVKKVQLLRYNLLEYLKAIHVDTAKIKEIYVQGGGYSELTRSILDTYGKDITFDFMGNDLTKSRFYGPKTVNVNLTYDRYVAVNVIINKPLLTFDQRHHARDASGALLNGIPYHGTPERGGVRVYLDGEMAFVIKRNSLGDVGRVSPSEPRWSLMKLLAANGIHPDIGGIDVVSDKDIYNMHRTRLAADVMQDPTFMTSSNASGQVVFGADNIPVNAFLLYSKGHVPPVKPIPPLQRDWQPGE
jgi:hypothetical protein